MQVQDNAVGAGALLQEFFGRREGHDPESPEAQQSSDRGAERGIVIDYTYQRRFGRGIARGRGRISGR
jgi:hypothetical protein